MASAISSVQRMPERSMRSMLRFLQAKTILRHQAKLTESKRQNQGLFRYPRSKR
jgi:hypothetical protein